MTTPVLASSNVMLEGGLSAVQGVVVLLFVALVAVREVLRVQDPRSWDVRRLDRCVRLVAPAVVLLLAVRLLVILQ